MNADARKKLGTFFRRDLGPWNKMRRDGHTGPTNHRSSVTGGEVQKVPTPVMGLFRAVAVDLDGTLAEHDRVEAETLAALRQVIARGLRVIAVTGRTLEDLDIAFPRLRVELSAVVAENGAVLASPLGIRDLADPVDAAIRSVLDARGVNWTAPGHRITAHHRHDHKYAVGRLALDRRFYFRDLTDQLTGSTAGSLAELESVLVACGLNVLRHHCPRHDISRWVADILGYRQLAGRLAEAEGGMETDSPAAVVEVARARLIAALHSTIYRQVQTLFAQPNLHTVCTSVAPPYYRRTLGCGYDDVA